MTTRAEVLSDAKIAFTEYRKRIEAMSDREYRIYKEQRQQRLDDETKNRA